MYFAQCQTLSGFLFGGFFSFPVTLYQLLRNKIINIENMESMKKKILFVGVFWVVAIVASLQFNSEKASLESLMLENIDALASGEWNQTTQCVGRGSVDCPGNHVKVYFVTGQYSLE